MSGYQFDYYEILGFKRISPTSDKPDASVIYEREGKERVKQYSLTEITPTEITAAYRQKAPQLHPDKETDPEKKRSKDDAFKRLATAYEFLSHEQERKEFNDWLKTNPEAFAKKQSLILNTEALSAAPGLEEKKEKQAVDLVQMYRKTPCLDLLKGTALASPAFAECLLGSTAVNIRLTQGKALFCDQNIFKLLTPLRHNASR